jgi:hypothetical protein
MLLYRFASIMIVSSCLCSPGPTQEAFPRRLTIPPSSEHVQDFNETVVPIASVSITPSVELGKTGRPGPGLDLRAKFGTGFCLDTACRFIVTNYHVAMAGDAHKIKGERIFRRYLATGPHDDEATVHILATGDVLPYATKRDLAIFELRHPLPHHHGLTFSLDELDVGQEVEIYGYPKGKINPLRKLTRFPATFKGPTTSGLLAFDYQSHQPILIAGASGGIVVDRKTEKIVGVLNATTETMALAVPVQTLFEFVSKVQPFLAQRIFASANVVSPVSADFYPKFAPPSDRNAKFVPTHFDGLQHRPEEPAEVQVLRARAQFLSENMLNFIATQSFEWGSENKEPDALAEYEVRVIDGAQRFREYPDGNKDLERVPEPRSASGWIVPAHEWSMLPKMVGTEVRLKVNQAADVVVDDRRIKVYQYYASVEDDLCRFAPSTDFGIFKIGRTLSVACYGEVWTDWDRNIIRMSEHLDLSDNLKAYQGWEEYQIVLTYGWLNGTGGLPALVPLTIFAEARYKKKHVYWCRGQFTNYRMFTSDSKMVRTTAAK